MAGLHLIPLGVGDAFSALHYSSCLAVECQGEWLLVDSPHPILKILRESGEKAGHVPPLERIVGLVLTHLHGDHASGLEILAFYYRFVLHRKLTLIAHPEVLLDLWPRYLAGSMEWSRDVGRPAVHQTPEDFFDLMPLVEKEQAKIGPFTVEGRPTQHSVPCMATRIRANGREIGYSADTIFDPGLIDWLLPADLIVHEAGLGFMHTPIEKLMELPSDVRARLRIIHYPDRHDVERSPIPCLRQGDWIAV